LPIQNKFGRIIFRIVLISQYLTVNYCMYGGNYWTPTITLKKNKKDSLESFTIQDRSLLVGL
jgi:hypothetical protein